MDAASSRDVGLPTGRSPVVAHDAPRGASRFLVTALLLLLGCLAPAACARHASDIPQPEDRSPRAERCTGDELLTVRNGIELPVEIYAETTTRPVLVGTVPPGTQTIRVRLQDVVKYTARAVRRVGGAQLPPATSADGVTFTRLCL
jgi:hypothetical protein